MALQLEQKPQCEIERNAELGITPVELNCFAVAWRHIDLP